jgi:hypothetical protein
MSIDHWSEPYDDALWVRAAERIDVPAGGTVPGPLDVEPLPEPTTGPDDGLAEGWSGWWAELTGQPRWPSGRLADLAAERAVMAGPPPPRVQFFPPDFPGLARWPALQRVVARRWPEVSRWHNERKTAGVAELRRHRPSAPESRVVADVERTLGRRVPAFDVEFVVVPVRDTQIRRLTEARYLVPESVYGEPDWTEWLRTLVLRLAG